MCWGPGSLIHLSENTGIPNLTLIVGPIASGKSTIANLPASRRGQEDRDVTVLDLDDVVQSIGGFPGLTSSVSSLPWQS
jgi:polynucleotide 5'-kinase involved in rRNA processing